VTTRKRPPSGVVWSMDDGKVVVDVEPTTRRPFGKPQHASDVSRSGDEVSGPHAHGAGVRLLELDTDEGNPVVDEVATEDDGAPV
jgi:hypothetical protein